MTGETTKEIVEIVDNKYKQSTFELYKIWRAIPAMFKRPPKAKDGQRPTVREFAEMMNIDDPKLVDLFEIGTQVAFAEKYDVTPTTLSRWNEEIDSSGELDEIRKWARRLSKNVVSAMYNNLMRHGYAVDGKFWFQLIESWEEKQKVEHNYKGVQVIEILDAENTVETNKETTPSVEIADGQDDE